jgi:hypothetical protein
VLAGVHEAESWGKVGAESEESAKGGDRGCWRQREGDCWLYLSVCCRHDVVRVPERDVLVSPDTVLMKICIVSSGSEVEELRLETLEVRRMVAECAGSDWAVVPGRG